MSRHRYDRRDKNHSQVRRWFEQLGFICHDTHAVGDGFPDMVVKKRRRVLLIEIKTKDGRMTEDQKKFAEKWGDCVFSAVTEEDVLNIYNTLTALK